MTTLLSFFTDPVLRAPTIGSMLMCLSASLVGVVSFLRRRSLIGESLSHAAFPGVVLACLVSTLIPALSSIPFSVILIGGGFLSALLGVYLIEWLEKRAKVKEDSALCFVLSAFFGVGVVLSSIIQFSNTFLYRKVLTFIYGQAATLRDDSLPIYFVLSLFVLMTIILFYREIQITCFDKVYAKSLGIKVSKLDFIIFLFIAFAVVIGVRSVGIVLMAAMLIAPAAAARQFTNKLGVLFLLSGIFGVASAFFGNVISYKLSYLLTSGDSRISFPTGPSIVLVSISICFFALLFSPKRGYLIRYLRVLSFRFRCAEENIIKRIWRLSKQGSCTCREINDVMHFPLFILKLLIIKLRFNGWIAKGKKVALSKDGFRKAEKIIRLHRLWEVYLVDCLQMGKEAVHKSAEDMEHILTPEMEKYLSEYLQHPKWDPHQQPIPSKEGAF